jgi:hypothetical protein
LAKVVYAAVDIGVLRTVQLRKEVDDTVGFLRGGSVVEIYQRVAKHFSAQYREVFPYLLDIEFHFLFFFCKGTFFCLLTKNAIYTAIVKFVFHIKKESKIFSFFLF